MSATNVYLEAARVLERAAQKHQEVLVAYSGGKDSLAVLDLCSRAFPRVVCFFMFCVPGLECCEEQLAYARQRWKVDILQYPHWSALGSLKNGVYCNNYFRDAAMPDFSFQDVANLAREDTGIQLVAHGGKEKDSLWRKRYFHSGRHEDLIYPLRKWNKWDVLGYLQSRQIRIPKQEGDKAAASGIGLTTRSLLWLADNWPSDFKKLCEVFPYAESVLWRRTWYGIRA